MSSKTPLTRVEITQRQRKREKVLRLEMKARGMARCDVFIPSRIAEAIEHLAVSKGVHVDDLITQILAKELGVDMPNYLVDASDKIRRHAKYKAEMEFHADEWLEAL